VPVYCEKLTIPANTSESAPVSLDITLKQKYITKMEVGFPDGCNYMVEVKIRYGIRQEWPEEEDTWLMGNNETISWEERYEIPATYENLSVYGASPGTSYNHEIVVRIMTLPTGFYFLETLLDKLYSLFRRIF
jgi:hypothetical protein